MNFLEQNKKYIVTSCGGLKRTMSKLLEFYLEHVQGISDMQQFMENYNRSLTVRDPLQHHIANELFIKKESDIDAIISDFDT